MSPFDPEALEMDKVLVRIMRPTDLESVVEIDAQATGRRRPEYFELMMRRAVRDAELQVSLFAEWEGRAAGFLIGSISYGEFGLVEPAASIDAIGVGPEYRGRSVGKSLMHQFRLNLGALRVATIRTEVSWDDTAMLAFFRSQSFTLSNRLCLEVELDPTAAG